MTKQVRFPTTRRKGPKSQTTAHVVSLCRTPSTSDSEPSNASKVIFAMALKVKGTYLFGLYNPFEQNVNRLESILQVGWYMHASRVFEALVKDLNHAQGLGVII